jgi:antitoxin HigA-1
MPNEDVMTRDIPVPHPGAILRDEFLAPMNLSVYALAKAIHVPRSRINEICHERQGISPSIALRLGRYFGVDPQWSTNMQARHDLDAEERKLAAELDAIQPFAASLEH